MVYWECAFNYQSFHFSLPVPVVHQIIRLRRQLRWSRGRSQLMYWWWILAHSRVLELLLLPGRSLRGRRSLHFSNLRRTVKLLVRRLASLSSAPNDEEREDAHQGDCGHGANGDACFGSCTESPLVPFLLFLVTFRWTRVLLFDRVARR
jgi:hypothetical protein